MVGGAPVLARVGRGDGEDRRALRLQRYLHDVVEVLRDQRGVACERIRETGLVQGASTLKNVRACAIYSLLGMWWRYQRGGGVVRGLPAKARSSSASMLG
eukprot:scaffold101084_cov39-Phaeocystis_antarctica.AAC.1